jgi:hypothetical protein
MPPTVVRKPNATTRRGHSDTTNMNLILGKNSVETCFHHCLRASLIASLLLATRVHADVYDTKTGTYSKLY